MFIRPGARPFAALATLFLLSTITAPVHAQPVAPAAPAPDPSAEPAASEPWKGFWIASDDGAFELNVGGYVHSDGLFPIDEDNQTDTFQLRRVRPRLRGKVFEHYAYSLLLDFAGGEVEVVDAYLDIPLVAGAKLRVGKTKGPVGLERLQSATALFFLERGLPTALAPNRDIGVLVHGNLAGGYVEYALGLFNGTVDGSSADVNADGKFDGYARFFAYPLRASGSLAGWGIGIAGSYGIAEGSAADPQLARYRTPTVRGQIFRYRVGDDTTDTVVADGARQRLAAQTYLPVKRFGLLAELALSRQDVALATQQATFTQVAWQVAGTFLLTDDRASFKGVKPAHAFAPAARGVGAVELAARIGQLRADEDAFPLFADPDASARSALSWTAGINWYLNEAVKAQLLFERSTFDGGAVGGHRSPENLVAGRVQLVL